MKTRSMLAALAALALVGPARARAEVPQPFVPTDQSVRPWEAGHSSLEHGLGEATGNAALPGDKRLLIVTPGATTQAFIVGRTQVVDGSGQPLAREALRDGARVKVDYDVMGNTNIARRVTVLAPPVPSP